MIVQTDAGLVYVSRKQLFLMLPENGWSDKDLVFLDQVAELMATEKYVAGRIVQ